MVRRERPKDHSIALLSTTLIGVGKMRNQQIDDAIALMASRGRAFSAKDIADFEEWQGLAAFIEKTLRRHCRMGTIIRLEGIEDDKDRYPHYLSKRAAKKWWVKSTLKLASTNVDYVTAAQLATSMSLSLGIGRRWDNPPKGMLNMGKEWAVVSEGCVPDSYVFPWAMLIRWDPKFRGVFSELFQFNPGDSWSNYSLKSTVDQMLSTLPDRESRVLQMRFGFRNSGKSTLEEIGREFGVTRERIRQIEVKALRKSRHPVRNRVLLLGLASEFIRSGGSLLMFESDRLPVHSLLRAIFGNKSQYIPELGVGVITDIDLWNFSDYLNSDSGHKLDDCMLATFLPFLSKADAARLRKPIETHKQKLVASWSRPRMILEALRHLGRAAHFQEIAERCNEMFPGRANTSHNWHAAMDRSERFGIVWIGRKGMYGLKEHGYSRPSKDLFESAADIVERKYSETRQPVSDDVVIEELGKVRRELNPNSVKMALSFSERLTSLGGGKFVPKNASVDGSEKDSTPRYNISAAFEAFSGKEDS